MSKNKIKFIIENCHELGDTPDSWLASKYNVSRKTIANARKKLSIQPFTGIILSQEKIPLRSILEAKYDAYLHYEGIEHLHEQKVGNSKYISDFKVYDLYIEVAGMIGYEKYNKKLENKRNYYKNNNIKVLWLYDYDIEELYKDCKVELNFRDRFCKKCNIKSQKIINGFCKKCNMEQWRENNQEIRNCNICNDKFKSDVNNRQKFCSYDCYWKSLETIILPSWKWIDEQLKTLSIRKLALKLNIKPSTLYKKLSKRK